MNEGKTSRLFGYPHSLILFSDTPQVVFHLPYRWMAETFFSGFKHTFEVVQGKKWERMLQEIRLKAWMHNLLLGLTAEWGLGGSLQEEDYGV